MPRPRAARRLPPAATGASLKVEIQNQYVRRRIDLGLMREGVQTVLSGEGIQRADISLAIVDDRTIHELNLRYLDHDEPTDVISFSLEDRAGAIDGEIVVSAETAASTAKRLGWSMADELLLYVIHGTLHLVGYDDLTDQARQKMRRREKHYLAHFGREPPDEQPAKARRRPRAPGELHRTKPKRNAKS